ncbi:MAG TPA: carboxypeptidase-like regulatory domain-containing protein, partial [Candidatus Sumerlaeota bacterium]|nr:carboxypeptidase-like regulatory domain-containing protein [Candidatus Sumerlaeota bacterium]
MGFEQGAQGNNCPFALFDATEKEVRVVVTKVESPKDSAQADLIGWVGGTVLDGNKQPIAGAIVSLYTGEESCVFEDTRTVTDTAGHFRLENLKCRKLAEGQSFQNEPEIVEQCYTEATQPPTVYAPVGVMVSAEGYSMTLSPIRIGTEREIVLVGKGDFKGRVVDKETDQPIPQFDLFCLEANKQYKKRIVSETGEFTLNGYVIEVTVSAEGYQEERVDLYRRALVEGVDNKELVIALKKGVPLQGYVVDEQTRAPLENVLVGCSSGFGESYRVYYFDEQHLDAEQVGYTNAEGYFDLNATFSRGGLAFYRSDREKLWVSLEDVERYRETDTGRLVFPLKPLAPSGSMEIIWLNRGVPAPAAWNERIGIQIITGVHENGYLYLAKLDDYSFQYE